MKRIACVVALAGAFVSLDAAAWGTDGHRAVGAIADKLIKGTHAEAEVKSLLLPGESLEAVSTWPDCVKGNWCGPQTPEMIEYVNANPKHSEYHYTDVPFQLDHYHDGAAGTADDDIVQTLKEAIAVLQGKDTPATNPHKFTRRQALILVTHLAGDIVQPLHVGAAFVDRNGKFIVPKTKAAPTCSGWWMSPVMCASSISAWRCVNRCGLVSGVSRPCSTAIACVKVCTTSSSAVPTAPCR